MLARGVTTSDATPAAAMATHVGIANGALGVHAFEPLFEPKGERPLGAGEVR